MWSCSTSGLLQSENRAEIFRTVHSLNKRSISSMTFGRKGPRDFREGRAVKVLSRSFVPPGTEPPEPNPVFGWPGVKR